MVCQIWQMALILCARCALIGGCSRMVKASTIAKVLGGEKNLDTKVSSQQDLITAVRRGLRVAAVDAVIEELDAPRTEVLPTLGLARRTIERRKRQGRLLPA